MEKWMLTVAETAEVLNVGKNRVYELIYSEQLRSVRFGRTHRIPVAAVKELIAELSKRDDVA